MDKFQSCLQEPRLNTSNNNLIKIKKAIIVVGKMGHGKSAFINSIIRPKSGEEPEWIKAQLVEQKTSLETITEQCSIRNANNQHDLIQDLQLIDTPGLDSKCSPSLVSQQIDDIILQKKCDIIGIAYVINLSNRQLGSGANSVLRQFLKVLKIKKQLKNKLIFFVLSKWDILCCNQEVDTINNLICEFLNLLKDIGLQNSECRLIKWASYKNNMSKVFKRYLQYQEGQQKVKQQWVKLKQILHQTNKSSLKIELHMQNINIFWQNLRQRLFSQIKDKNISYNQDDTKIDYNLEITLRDWDIIQQQKNVMEVAMKIPLVNLFALLYSVVTWFRKKQTKVIQNSVEPSLNVVNKYLQKKLNKQIQSKLKSAIILGVVQNILVTKDKIVFNKIGQSLKISKLLTYYVSQFSSLPLKVPITFLYEQQLKQKITIQCSFDKKNEEQSLRYQEGIVETYRNKPYKVQRQVRIPKHTKFFVKKDQQKFIIRIKAFCKLPKQQNYLGLIKQESIKMFGKYQ